MLKKSKKSSASRTRTNKALEKPFAQDVLKRAGKIADQYRLLLEKNKMIGYVGSSVELPAVFADGRSPADCVKNTQQALTIAVATMIEAGQKPPAPSSSGKREVQVNVRLTSDEKFLLQEAARRSGFKGISDFVRNAALEHSSRH